KRVSTVELLTRLAEGTNGRYFQVDDASELPAVYRRIEELLAAERILTVPDPDPMSRPPHVEIGTRVSGCRIVDLDRPDAPRFRPGTAHAPGRRLLSPAHRLLLDRASELQLESACADTYDPGISEAWVLARNGNDLAFCTPDIVRAPGLLYRSDSRELIEDFRGVEISIRRLRTRFPPIEDVIAEPWQLLDRLATSIPNVGMEGWRRSDRLLHGRAFLESRGLLAAAGWESPEWKAFARERLQREADEGIDGLRTRYERQFPDASASAVDTAVRFSAEGIVLAHRITAPDPIDLQPHLAAWLGDLPVHDLFVRWERATWMRDGPDADFPERWNAVRDLFRYPRFGRVVAALEPAYDPGCDCLGYWRIQLPRPGLLHPRRALGELGREDVPLDLIPEEPLIWRLLSTLAERDAAWAEALGPGSELTDSSYRLEGPAIGWIPGRAFRNVSLRVSFRDPAGRRLELTAQVRDALLDPDVTTSDLPERPARWMAEQLRLTREGAAPVPAPLAHALPRALELPR
ncbi:MAG: hypothetical protein OER88_10085, partial [Planctomycetota bacterium]|nr:hypothetical protein [Planctomycetota bacterium]